MPNVNSIASLYEAKITNVMGAAYTESRDSQTYLEAHGFSVTRNDDPIKFEASRNLIAAKGNVVLEVSLLLRGGAAYSLRIKEGNHEKRIPLDTDKLEEAVAYAEAAIHLAK